MKNIVENKDLFLYEIDLILEYIEIWDENLQIHFAKAIFNCFKFISYRKNDNNFGSYIIEDNYNKDDIQQNIFSSNIKRCEILYQHIYAIINKLIKFLMKMISLDDLKVKL